MSVLEQITIKSGEIVPVTGYYAYKTNPEKGEIPCYPPKGERVIVLEKGQIAPPVGSCNNHPAVWQLVTEKKSTTLVHTH